MSLFNKDHLSEVEETYIEHFKFAFWAAGTLFLLSIISFIHAIFPFLFSRMPDKIYRYFQRKSKERVERVNKILKDKGLEN
jgi:hypothetical protein